MKRKVVLAVLLVLAGCGGGGDSSTPAAAPPPQSAPAVAAGRYSFNAEPANLVTASDELIYFSKQQLGFGAWNYVGTEARATITLLNRPIDDLGNEFPSARTSGTTRALTASAIGLNNRTAPALTTIPRNWRFANLYRFGANFVDYTVQIDIDSAGVLTGFDTHGCAFAGELRERTDAAPLYDARVVTTGCGATAQFIENTEYKGHAYIEPGPAAGQTVLVINAVNPTQQGGLGLALSLFMR